MEFKYIYFKKSVKMRNFDSVPLWRVPCCPSVLSMKSSDHFLSQTGKISIRTQYFIEPRAMRWKTYP